MTALKPVIQWFRNDLRLADNRALAAAQARGAPLVLLYVLDETTPGRWAPGAATRWWLHMSLAALARSIATRGGSLVLRRGAALDVVAGVAAETGADTVYCSRAYEPWAAALEGALSDRLDAAGVTLRRFGGRLLREPEEIRTQAGEPYRVFTPFWRAIQSAGAPRRPLPAPRRLAGLERAIASDCLDDWRLRPTKPDWAGGMRAAWRPGEDQARARLVRFVRTGVARYNESRDLPGVEGTSRLSPHLAMGEISPATVWHAVATHAAKAGGMSRGAETFLKELAWREFSAHLLFHYPHLPEQALKPDLAAFPWASDERLLAAWQRGLTGYPIVDAGMRELWATGHMHNRVRMIVASFLIKDLLIPWQRGEAWFWDTLVDADLANNSASWQWVAGTGADAAPYFRIFNPTAQGERYDPDGTYVRRWLPELERLPAPTIHAPWNASEAELAAAGIKFGESYPRPVVDHAAARRRALAAYEHAKAALKAPGSATP